MTSGWWIITNYHTDRSWASSFLEQSTWWLRGHNACKYCGRVQHCMWRGVKTSTWSPQLLFVSGTHNNLLSIPTSTNHTLHITFLDLSRIFAKELKEEEVGAIPQIWSNWNFCENQRKYFSTTCQEMSDSRKYWWLSISSRKRLPCFVELLRIPETERDPVSMSIPETRVAETRIKWVFMLSSGAIM